MLSDEMCSPEKLASHPPAIKISGDIPMESDARCLLPRGQAVAVISFTTRAGVVLLLISWGQIPSPKAALRGTLRSGSQLPGDC